MYTRSKEEGLKDFHKLNNALEQASKGSIAVSGDIPKPESKETGSASTSQAVKPILKRVAMSKLTFPSSQAAGKSKKRKQVSWTEDTDFKDDKPKSKKARSKPDRDTAEDASCADVLKALSSSDLQTQEDPRVCKSLVSRGDFVVENVYNLRSPRRNPGSPQVGLTPTSKGTKKKKVAANPSADKQTIEEPVKKSVKQTKAAKREPKEAVKHVSSACVIRGSIPSASEAQDAEEKALHEKLASDLFPEFSSTPPVSNLSSFVASEKTVKKPLFRPSSTDSTAASDNFYFFDENADAVDTADVTGGLEENGNPDGSPRTIEEAAAVTAVPSKKLDVPVQDAIAGAFSLQKADLTVNSLENSIEAKLHATPIISAITSPDVSASPVVPSVPDQDMNTSQDAIVFGSQKSDSKHIQDDAVEEKQEAASNQPLSDQNTTVEALKKVTADSALPPQAVAQAERVAPASRSKRKAPQASDRKTRSSAQQVLPALPRSHILAGTSLHPAASKKMYQRSFYPSKAKLAEISGSSASIASIPKIASETANDADEFYRKAGAAISLLYEATLCLEGCPPQDSISSVGKEAIPVLDAAEPTLDSCPPTVNAPAGGRTVKDQQPSSNLEATPSELDTAQTLLLSAQIALEYQERANPEPDTVPDTTDVSAEYQATLPEAPPDASIQEASISVEVMTNESIDSQAGIPRTPSPSSERLIREPVPQLPPPADLLLSQMMTDAAISSNASEYSPICPSCSSSSKKRLLDGHCFHARAEGEGKLPSELSEDSQPVPESHTLGKAYSSDPQDCIGTPDTEIEEGTQRYMRYVSPVWNEPQACNKPLPEQTLSSERPHNQSPYGRSKDSFTDTGKLHSSFGMSGQACSPKTIEPEDDEFPLPPPLLAPQPKRVLQDRITREQAARWQAIDTQEVDGLQRLLEGGLSKSTLDVAMTPTRIRNAIDLPKDECQKQLERKYGLSKRSGYVTSSNVYYAHAEPIPDDTGRSEGVKENIYPSMLATPYPKKEAKGMTRLPGNPNGWQQQPEKRSKSAPTLSSKGHTQTIRSSRRSSWKGPQKKRSALQLSGLKSAGHC